MSPDAGFPYPEWPELAHRGVPYEDPVIGRRIAQIQMSSDSDIAARSISAVSRELEWIGLTGRERIFHPFCGPGNYAAQIGATSGCLRYVGHDVNPAAVELARQRNSPPTYTFQVTRFSADAVVPSHDLCLLSYETVNVFAPDQLPALLTLMAESLSPEGRAFVDVRTRDDPGIPLGVFPPQHVPAGQGIFSGAEHTMEYAARVDHDGRLAVERFRLRLGSRNKEFYSWLWLYEEAEIVTFAERAGLTFSRSTRLHADAPTGSPGSSSSVQLLFRK
jgi:hypothetical protein